MTNIVNNGKPLAADGEKGPQNHAALQRQVARQVEAALDAIRPLRSGPAGNTGASPTDMVSRAEGLILPFHVPTAGDAFAPSGPILFPFPSLAQRIALLGHPPTQAASLSTRQEVGTSPPAQEHLYEGAVQVRIQANGDVRSVVHFVRALCQRTEVRLVRLVSDRFGGSTNLWLALREPLPLLTLIRQIAGVSLAYPLSGDAAEQGSCLEVCLGKDSKTTEAAA